MLCYHSIANIDKQLSTCFVRTPTLKISLIFSLNSYNLLIYSNNITGNITQDQEVTQFNR